MKNSKKMIQIILLCFAGLITLGLSINSIIESAKKEKELEKTQFDLINKQDFLIDLQNKHAIEIQEKTNEIIKLQSLLRDNSESQLKDLDRLKNPIPENLQINFSSIIEMSPIEIIQINDILKLKSASHGGNLLPFDSNQINEGFDKINRFKNIFFRLIITFHKDGKTMEVAFNRGPINLYGYNTRNSSDSFTLAFMEDKSIVSFNGFGLETNAITTNYKSPSLLDFENSKVSILYDFSFPQLMQTGSLPSNVFVTDLKDQFLLKFESIFLIHKNYRINIGNFKRIASQSYEGDLLIDK